MKRLHPLVALIALAGCDAEESAANRAAEANVSVADAVPAAPATVPAKAEIPQRFRGLWAEDQRVCGALTHNSRLVIGDNDLRFPDVVIEVEAVTGSGDSFAVKGRNKKSGAAIEAHYSLDVTGNILTDEAGGGAVRVRCG